MTPQLALVLLAATAGQAVPWTDPDALLDALDAPRPGRIRPAPTPEPAPAPDATDGMSFAEPPPAAADDECGPAPPGWLSVNTHPWTRVSVDDEDLGSTPLFRARLGAGVHRLRLWNEEAGVDELRELEVESRRTTKLHLFLGWQEARDDLVALTDTGVVPPDEECAEDDVATGFLSIHTHPWARVFIDGRAAGSTPLFRHPVKPGGHSLRLERENADGSTARMRLRFDVARGETVKIVLDSADPADRGS